MEARTYHSKRQPVRRSFSGPGSESRTKQSFKDESDINHIVKRYQKAGVPLTMQPGAIFGDFTDADTFRRSHDAIATAKSEFEKLPSNVRNFFDNDVALCIDFMANPENEADCIELGLMPKKQKEASSGAGAPAEIEALGGDGGGAPVQPPE